MGPNPSKEENKADILSHQLEEAQSQLEELLHERHEAEEQKLKEPWRSLPRDGKWNLEFRNKLIDDIKGQQAYGDLSYVRIVLLGPIASGKSSFINTVATIDHDRFSSPMEAGEDVHSVSKALKQYKSKRLLKNFVLTDSMGIEETSGCGFNVQDVIYLLEGHVKLTYKFNPQSPLTPSDPQYKSNPADEDKTHCSVVVIPAPTIHTDAVSDISKKKIEEIRKHVSARGLPVVILLTKIDLIDDEVKKDITKVYNSLRIKTTVTKAHALYGVPEMNIFPVRNYSCEQKLDHNMEILVLLALLRMMEIAYDRLEQIEDNRVEDKRGAVAVKQEL